MPMFRTPAENVAYARNVARQAVRNLAAAATLPEMQRALQIAVDGGREWNAACWREVIAETIAEQRADSGDDE